MTASCTACGVGAWHPEARACQLTTCDLRPRPAAETGVGLTSPGPTPGVTIDTMSPAVAYERALGHRAQIETARTLFHAHRATPMEAPHHVR